MLVETPKTFIESIMTSTESHYTGHVNVEVVLPNLEKDNGQIMARLQVIPSKIMTVHNVEIESVFTSLSRIGGIHALISAILGFLLVMSGLMIKEMKEDMAKKVKESIQKYEEKDLKEIQTLISERFEQIYYLRLTI